jgi:hypothetical protein
MTCTINWPLKKLTYFTNLNLDIIIDKFAAMNNMNHSDH